MKKIKLNKPVKQIDTKTKIIAAILASLMLAGLVYSILRAVNQWYATHELQFNKVVTVELKKPIEIKERKVESKEIIKVIEEVPEPEDLETDAEKKIYEVFGIENYKMALSVAAAESGMNCNAVNAYNSNGSVDLSIFQVNSLWIEEYSLAEISDCMRNIEIAYDIWDRADGTVGDNKGSWTPWVAAKDGKHIKFLR